MGHRTSSSPLRREYDPENEPGRTWDSGYQNLGEDIRRTGVHASTAGPDPPPTPRLGAVSPKPAPKKTLLAQTTQKMMFRQAIRLQEDKANQTDTQKIINSRQSQFHTSVTNRGMAADPQSVAQLLQASLDAKQAKQAQEALEQQQPKKGFSLTLLQITASESYPLNTRLASALYFKNFIKRNWADEDGQYKLPEDEVNTIKQQIIGLMISVPGAIKIQIGEAISVIAESDFYERWDTLVDDLVSRLQVDDPVANNGVLQVAHSIFKRWRPLFRSDGLFTEINHVLAKFGNPYLKLLDNVDQSIENSQSDKPKLQQAFANLDLLVKLFLDLSCQDLPPMFEDGLPHIATFLHKYLVYDNPLLHSTDDSEASPLEFVKAGILEALVLYTSKYGDAFGDYVQQFMTATWNLLSATGTEVKYDILVSKALQFMTQVTKISGLGLFDTEHVLNSIVEKVIIPNLSLRDADIEILEDEPIEFVRRDLEGPDSDTRRKAATDFLRQLLETPNSQITPVVMRYIDHYMSEYAKSPKDNWRSKDLAIYLFTSIAAKGVSTTSHGITSTNQLVDIGDFFQKNIASDLTSEDAETILKMDALKYLYTFRNVLNKDQWQQILPVLVNRLGSSDYVVYTYAAIVVERVLALTDSAHQPIIDQAMITPLAKDLIEHLFKLIEQNPAPEKVQENEFLMRCVMRVIIFIREGVISVAGIVLAHLIGITNTISSNPSNPRFYYYHFEALGAFIRFAAPSSASTLENALYQPFAIVLQNNTEEFLPYVLQLFAFLLEANPSGTLPDMYQSMLGPLLTPPLWEQKGNVPALVRLLSALMSRMTSLIVENGQIEPILGIFQKLVSSKTNESYGFDLLEAVVTTFPPPAIQPFFGAVLGVIFARLSKTRTENLALKFTRWYHVVSARQDKGLGADFFIAGADQTQHDIFRQLYPQVIVPESQKLARPIDRKLAVVSFTRTLADSANFVERYKKGWTLSCNAMLAVLENPIVPQTADPVITDLDVNDMSFGVGFTQLNTVKKNPQDPYPEIIDVKKWVGQYLAEANQRHNGRIGAYAQEMLQPEAQQALSSYMQR